MSLGGEVEVKTLPVEMVFSGEHYLLVAVVLALLGITRQALTCFSDTEGPRHQWYSPLLLNRVCR